MHDQVQECLTQSIKMCTAGYQLTNGIQIKVNGLTGDLLANVTDTAVEAGGDDVIVDSIEVSHHCFAWLQKTLLLPWNKPQI